MPKQAQGIPFFSTERINSSIRRAIGFTICLVGLADMLSAIVPKLNWDILLGAWPFVTHRIPAQTLTVVVGFFLIMLSYGLTRGKKHAWRITLVLLLLSAILHVLRSGSILATVVALALTIVLSTLSNFFRARSDPPSVWRGYTALILGLGVVMFYTIGGFLTIYHGFEPLFDRFATDRMMLRSITNPHLRLLAHQTPAFFFERALPILCISAVLYGMIQVFRPVAAVFLPDKEKKLQATEQVRIYGKSSISYFALDSDKSYFFSDSGKSLLCYVLEGSTAVVAGDPIGHEQEMGPILKQFITFCREQDWTIVFWQVRAELIDLYRAMGLHLLKIGEDAIIDVQNFTLKGSSMANVRSSAKRAEKEGLQIMFYWGQVPDQRLRLQMEQISHTWLSSKGGSEMGFSMGHFDPQGDKELLTALAVDTNQKVHAFVTFVPIYGRHGWGLDLMRRAAQPAPGTMELLLSRSIEYMKCNNAEMMSLGLAPLGNVNNDEETFLGNSIDFLSERFGNINANQSLFHFKKKFQPIWESRYLAYSDTLSLPRTGWALYRAHQREASLIGTLRTTLGDWQRNRQCLQAKSKGPLEATQA